MVTFDLFGTVWTVKMVDTIANEDSDRITQGVTHPNNIIEIARKYNENDEISKSERTITLLHEIIHAIFNTGQYLQSTEDEPLVEWTARCLNSLIKQDVWPQLTKLMETGNSTSN